MTGRRAAWAAALWLGAAPAAAFVRESTAPGDPRGLCLWWASDGAPAWAPGDTAWLGHRGPTWQLSTAHPPSGCASFEEAQGLVRQAFAQWNQATVAGEAAACTDFGFVEGPTTPSQAIGHDGVNLVVWRHGDCATVAPPGDPCLTEGGCGNRYNCWEADGIRSAGMLALTWIVMDLGTGEVLDTDMELQDWDGVVPSDPSLAVGWPYTCAPLAWSAAPQPCASPFGRTDCTWVDVGNTVTHEAGHMVGLDHVRDQSATMYPQAGPGTVQMRTLAPDDVAGICAIYPRGRPTATCITPAGGCGCGGGTAASGLWALLAPWLLRRRSRRPGGRLRAHPEV